MNGNSDVDDDDGFLEISSNYDDKLTLFECRWFIRVHIFVNRSNERRECQGSKDVSIVCFEWRPW